MKEEMTGKGDKQNDNFKIKRDNVEEGEYRER